MAELTCLESFDEENLKEINGLLHQLSDRAPECTPELLRSIIDNKTAELWIVKEGEVIVGMGELALVLKPEGVIAQIEDVIVDEGQRGKGFGRVIN